MRAEGPTISRRARVSTRINNFLAGGPLNMPDSITNLDLRYSLVGETVLDSQEAKRMDQVLAGVDAAASMLHEGVDSDNEVVIAIWGEPRSVPRSRGELSAINTKARLEAHKTLRDIGLLKYAKISRNAPDQPSAIEARDGFRIRERKVEGKSGVEQVIFTVEENRYKKDSIPSTTK